MPGIGVGERRKVEYSTRIFRPSISMPEHFFKASSESSYDLKTAKPKPRDLPV